MHISIPNDWEPYPWQAECWDHLAKQKGKKLCVVAHRRSGKDSFSLNYTVWAALQTKGNYWHLLPTQRQARKVVWQAVDRQGRRVLDQVFPPEIRLRTSDQEMLIELVNGSIWQLTGSDRYDALVGSNPRGIVFSEYSISNPQSWNYLRPILVENGGWAIFIYTPRGKSHGYDMAKMAESSDDWMYRCITINDSCRHDGSPIITPEQVEQEVEQGMSWSTASQEFYCDFDAPVEGAYFAEELATARADGRVGFVPVEPGLPTYTFWDLGISAGNSTAIWFVQAFGKEIRLVKSYEATDHGMSHFIQVVENFAREHHVEYRAHYAPHDIKVRELTSGVSRLDTAREMGIIFQVVPRTSSLADSIEDARKIFNRCFFDVRRCESGLAALAAYRRDYDEKNQVLRDRPVHDWASNLADAFRQMAQAWKDSFARQGRPRRETIQAPFGEIR